MLYISAIAAALSVGLGVLFVLDRTGKRSRALTRRLAEIQTLGMDVRDRASRQARHGRRVNLERILVEVGEKLPIAAPAKASLRLDLAQAGVDHPQAVAVFTGVRLFLVAGLGVGTFAVLTSYGGARGLAVGAALYGAAMGWILPRFWIYFRRTRRQREIRRVLPDALDLLVVCVEAGLGLNQALVRVAREISGVSREFAKDLALTNLQIRAGSPRPEALRGLAQRSGLPEVQALATTIMQTDRFGTSVARSLRIHSETLRTQRRQESEEAAAKTTIKMVFPLVLFIFPALFVVILGPGLISMALAFTQNF